jgi:hypothetical protein
MTIREKILKDAKCKTYEEFQLKQYEQWNKSIKDEINSIERTRQLEYLFNAIGNIIVFIMCIPIIPIIVLINEIRDK